MQLLRFALSLSDGDNVGSTIDVANSDPDAKKTKREEKHTDICEGLT
jgi:hypothetical protein